MPTYTPRSRSSFTPGGLPTPGRPTGAVPIGGGVMAPTVAYGTGTPLWATPGSTAYAQGAAAIASMQQPNRHDGRWSAGPSVPAVTANTGGGNSGGSANTGGDTTGGGSTGSGDGAEGGDSGSGSTGPMFTEGESWQMGDTVYSALDAQQMLADPNFFVSEWLRANGMNSPGMAGRFGKFAEMYLPMLSILAYGTDPVLGWDAETGSVGGEELVDVRGLEQFRDILAGMSTPGGYRPDTMQYIADILGTDAITEGVTPSYLQAATQLNAETADGTASFGEQASNTNALLNAAMAFAPPGMRSLVANTLAYMGNQYRNATLDANSPEGKRPAYTEWLNENMSNWGVR